MFILSFLWALLADIFIFFYYWYAYVSCSSKIPFAFLQVLRRETKYVIIGAGSILAYHIYLSSQAILFSFLDFRYIPVTSIVVLMSCVMMMFAVVRNRVFDVNIFVSRYIIYNSLTILLSALISCLLV